MNLVNLWVIRTHEVNEKKKNEVKEKKKKRNETLTAYSHNVSTGSWKRSWLFVLSLAYFTRGALSDQDVAWSSEDS